VVQSENFEIEASADETPILAEQDLEGGKTSQSPDPGPGAIG
jgi:hypothetical protein